MLTVSSRSTFNLTIKALHCSIHTCFQIMLNFKKADGKHEWDDSHIISHNLANRKVKSLNKIYLHLQIYSARCIATSDAMPHQLSPPCSKGIAVHPHNNVSVVAFHLRWHYIWKPPCSFYLTWQKQKHQRAAGAISLSVLMRGWGHMDEHYAIVQWFDSNILNQTYAVKSQ